MAQNYYYDFGQDNGGIQAISPDAIDGISPNQLLVRNGDNYQNLTSSRYTPQPVNPDWADLQSTVRSIYGDPKTAPSSFQMPGTNTGYILEWSQDPAMQAFNQASMANPAGFEATPTPTQGYTPTIQNATYVADWNQALKDADNGGFMADYGWMLPLAIATLGPAIGGMGAAGTGAAGTGGAISSAEAATAMGSGIDAAGWGGMVEGTGGLDLMAGAEAAGTAGGIEAASGAETAGGVEAATEPQFYDDWGMGSNAAGEMTNAAGQRAWQDVAAETLRDLGIPRDTVASIVSGISSVPINGIRQGASAINALLGGGGSVVTRSGASSGAGGLGIMPIPVGQNKSIIESMMGGEQKSGLDEFMRLMAQSGKGA